MVSNIITAMDQNINHNMIAGCTCLLTLKMEDFRHWWISWSPFSTLSVVREYSIISSLKRCGLWSSSLLRQSFTKDIGPGQLFCGHY
jgi:hypothetical protein